uniref:K Homology domain-containing protein n=1 Tax=Ascaris lumbricoides TaxID=6252 RepID=A0A9J2Q1D0_ASCLU
GSITTSSYSTDLSSDFSEFRRCALPSSRRNCAPPLVLPEMSDSDAEQSVFSEVALPEYEGRRSPNRGGRPMARRSQISSISENTSPSSASSRDHSENMTSSRSSFLELIGLRKKKERDECVKRDVPLTRAAIKKRKRKISESDSIQSSGENTQKIASSRSSFLELIGLRKKKERDECVKRDVPLTRAAIKKRKRKISESDSIQSSGENTQKIEKRIAPSTYNRAPISTQHESGEQPKKSLLQTPKQYRPMRHSRTSPRYFDESDEEESTDSCRPQLTTPFLEPGNEAACLSRTSPRYFDESDEEESTDSCRPQLTTPFLEPEGIWNRAQTHVLRDDNEVIRNELTMIRSRNARLIEQLREKSMEHSKLTAQMATLQKQSRTSPRYFDESDEEESTDSCRPQLTTPFLEPEGIWNRAQTHVLRDDNEVIRNELTMIRNRNARLIEQLREKSMEHSKLTAQMATLQKQLESLQNRCHLNAELERLSLTERLIAGPSTVMSAIEEKLRHFEEDLQIAKSEALRNQQAAINSSLREQSAYQACLEQVERLQRENFSLLQLRASELAMQDKHIRQLLEMMPSYDALYSFTMGIVRKLSQMRTSFIDKAAHASRADLELLHTQSSLLITHAQIERMRLQLCASASKHPPRPVSYHGEDLFERMIKPKLNFLLPFKLHGQRVDKYRRSESTNMESEVEKNEQNIETEFLRLFDYARCLSRICEGELSDTDRERTPPTPQLLQSKNDQSAITTAGEDRSCFTVDYNETRFLLFVSLFLSSGLILGERGQLLKNAVNRTAIMQRDRRNAYSGRPISLVETPERKISGAACMRRFAEEVIKRNERRDEPVSNLNLHRFANCGHVKPIVSSLQDVSNSLTRSPSSTPIMTRRIPSLVNCQKQTSLDRYSQPASPHYHHLYEAHKYDCPPSRSSQSSDYAAISIKQSNMGYANIEKKRALTSKPSPLLSGSRLRMPNNCSPTALPFTRDSGTQMRRNTIGSNNSSTSLNAPDGRGELQIRRNTDQISVIREESPPPTSILPERRRLPKPTPSPTEKKKNTSWLSRLKPSKK